LSTQSDPGERCFIGKLSNYKTDQETRERDWRGRDKRWTDWRWRE